MAVNRGTARYRVELARPDQVREAQRLRYRVFAEELGARLADAGEGLDRDGFDDFCRHLLVRDTLTGRSVASTRVLDEAGARAAGGYYSLGEFDMGSVLNLRGRFIEVGRTCVDPAYRNGAVIATLWQGIGEQIGLHGADYLFGCASVPFRDDPVMGRAVVRQIMRRHLSPTVRVHPRHPLGAADAPDAERMPRLPALIRTYLSLGARACGAPCWDPDFGVADVFMLLNLSELNPRFARHFLPGVVAPPREVAVA